MKKQFVMETDLVARRLEVFPRLKGILPVGGNEVHKRPRPLNVPKKPRSQSYAGVSVLDQTGNIGDHDSFALMYGGSERRGERRERVGGDFRAGGRQRREQCGFAGIRGPDDSHIRQNAKLQADPSAFAFFSESGFSRRAIRGRGEMDVSESATTALFDQDSFVRLGDFRDTRAGIRIKEKGSEWNENLAGVSARARPLSPAAPFPVVRPKMPVISKILKRREMGRTHKQYVPPAAAVPPVRPPFGYEFHSAETDVTVSAVTGFDEDFRFIHESGSFGQTIQLTAGTTLTFLRFLSRRS